MHFADRREAGKLLAQALQKYRNEATVVYALPRGGVVTALEIAHFLQAPLDLIITRKIGHPLQPEYAIAATAENGHTIKTQGEVKMINQEWFANEVSRQRQEAKRRREKYLPGRAEIPVKGKIAILVDDGIATGLTMRVGIQELKHRQPKKIVVAVPIAPQTTANLIASEVEEMIALDVPQDRHYLGAVGAYYDDFSPVEDEEVMTLMQSYEKEYANIKKAAP